MERFTDTKALRKLMVDFGIDTIGELADLSGVNRNTLSDVLSGKVQPSAETMLKLSIAFDLEPQQAGCVFFAVKLAENVS